MIKRFVRVRNASEVRQRIADYQFPGGGLEIEAGEEASIPTTVYHRVWRRCSRWMQNLDVPASELQTQRVEAGGQLAFQFDEEDQTESEERRKVK